MLTINLYDILPDDLISSIEENINTFKKERLNKSYRDGEVIKDFHVSYYYGSEPIIYRKHEIIKKFLDYYELPESFLGRKNKSRLRDEVILICRRLIVILRLHANMSFQNIGKSVRGLGHATVIYHSKTFYNEMNMYQAEIEEMNNICRYMKIPLIEELDPVEVKRKLGYKLPTD